MGRGRGWREEGEKRGEGRKEGEERRREGRDPSRVGWQGMDEGKGGRRGREKKDGKGKTGREGITGPPQISKRGCAYATTHRLLLQ